MKQLVVGVGDGGVSRDPDSVIVTYALGSCVAVMLYDPVAGVAGMVHYMLPESSMSTEKSQRPAMDVRRHRNLVPSAGATLDHGADKRRLVVFAAGGAQVMDDNGSLQYWQTKLSGLAKGIVEIRSGGSCRGDRWNGRQDSSYGSRHRPCVAASRPAVRQQEMTVRPPVARRRPA